LQEQESGGLGAGAGSEVLRRKVEMTRDSLLWLAEAMSVMLKGGVVG
jgi:hypothetical protein